MSIADELQNYNDGLLEAYDAVNAKGGTIPANKNLDNLPTAIGTISGGGGGYDPTDPEQVYRVTRPADWLVMPEIGENEDNVVYLLLMVDADRTEDTAFQMIVGGDSTNTATWEFGSTDSAGNFTPIPSLTDSATGSTVDYPAGKLPMSAFGNTTSDGHKQVICKITATGDITSLTASDGEPAGIVTRKILREFKGKATSITSVSAPGNLSSNATAANLAYFSLQGTNRISGTSFNNMFQNCYSLITVLQLDTSGGTSFSSMFQYCNSLTTIPQLDTSSGTTFNSMFLDCHSLTTIPQLDTSGGTTFQNMFAYCYSLTAIPQLDTSNGTDFSYMFRTCTSLTTIPQLDTSNGTDFSDMFAYCYSLTAIPQFDTPAGTNFSNMFRSCHSLTEADLTGYDFSAVTSATGTNFILDSTAIGLTIELGDKWPVAGIPSGNTSFKHAGSIASADVALRIKINKTDAMLPLRANATAVFGTQDYCYVYVPDALLATYQADAYWNTLGTRLKGFSELPS